MSMDSSELVMAAEERFEEEADDSWSSDEGYWLESEDDEPSSSTPNALGGLQSNRRRKPSPLHELEGRVDFGVSNLAVNGIRGYINTIGTGKTRRKDKADHATIDGVLDQPTLVAIEKFLNNGELDIFSDYCISTGKEANVYYAKKSDGEERAVKVYRTSILEYKDRARFLEGGYRFQRRCNVHNPRKMVAAWAFKEMRNLLRLRKEGILCPNPRGLKRNVLVMDFIGKDGGAAPRLNDAGLSLRKLCEGYVEIIIAMRNMYQKCKLVHGDLSEYNILYHEGHLYIIDVSQSVDLDHPRADEFLLEDCVHVSGFFEKHGVAVMTVDDLLDFICRGANEDVDSHLEKIQQKIELLDTSAEEKNSDSVLIKMDQVESEDINEESELESESESSEDEDDNGEGNSERNFSPKTESPVDRKAARKENKRRVKEEKREARKHKVPKAIRKRRKKKSKHP